jgi:hypothetical protein
MSIHELIDDGSFGTRHKTIRVNARAYEDHDDCLAAAARDVAKRCGLRGYSLDAQYADDDDREWILVTVPSWVQS